MPNPARNRGRSVVVAAVTAALLLLTAASAFAHGFSSVVYVDVTSPERGHVRTELGLEYDLLVVSAADAQKDDPLFREGTAAFENADSAEQAAALDAHADSVLAYVTKRFGVSVHGGGECTPTRDGGVEIKQRVGVPYAFLVLDYRCPENGDAHVVRSELFPDSEGYVKGTKTIVTYDLDFKSGSASLEAKHPTFSTHQSLLERYWEFFRLGAEHLYTGIDHILFLLALIAGSRRLREIVLTASTFTLAHSVTFILAALGLVAVPASIVEPTIALSISVVAGLHLWRIARRGSHATDLETTGHGLLGLDASGRARLVAVFCLRPGARARVRRGARNRRGLLVDAAVVAARLQRGHRVRAARAHPGRSSPCSPCCAAAHRSPGSRRPGRSPPVCARWAWCGLRERAFQL